MTFAQERVWGKTVRIAACALVVAACVASGYAGEKASKAEKESPFSARQEAILDAFFRLETGSATKGDANALQNLARSRNYSFYALPLLVRFERESKKDAAASLNVIASCLYTSDEDNQAFRNSLKTYRETVELAKKEPNVTVPPLSVPDPQGVNLSYAWCAVEASRSLMMLGKYDDAIGLVNVVGQKIESFPRVMAADAAGDVFAMQRQWQDAARWYDSALKFHAAWKKMEEARAEEKTGDDAEDVGPSVWKFIEGTILANIRMKRAEVRRLAEMDELGPGYYLYKEAEEARRGRRDFRYAVAIHEEILDAFGETVYGDAAQCYRILSLLELSKIDAEDMARIESGRMNALLTGNATHYEAMKNPAVKTDPAAKKDAQERRLKEIENESERVPWWPQKGDAKAMTRELVRMVNGDGSDSVKEETQVSDDTNDNSSSENIASSSKTGSANLNQASKTNTRGKDAPVAATPTEEDGKRFYEYDPFAETPAQKMLRRSRAAAKVPTGKEAAKRALALHDAFLAEQKFGLYRGEAMTAVATHVLEEEFDLKGATVRFREAVQWFKDVKEFDQTIATFVLMENVRKTSAPPSNLKKKDMWGNISWVDSAPHQIENRRTSQRYLPYQHMMAQTRLAFCLFVAGKKEEAIPLLDIILESDPTEAEFQKTGWPNSYARFKAEFEQDRLFATKEDLQHFKGKAKLAIMIADYYYELEQWQEAAKRYRRFERDFAQDLDPTAQAYLTLMLGFAESTTGTAAKALPIFQKFEGEAGKPWRKTPSWARANFWLFTHYQNKPETRARALACLGEVRKYAESGDDRRMAHLYQGIMHYAFGQYAEATRIFRQCEKEYRGTWIATGAANYLKLVKEKQEATPEASAREGA